MLGEYWSGWFDHWKEHHHTVRLTVYMKTLEMILKRGASVNLYMFHGGTNFNFWNGANMFWKKNLKPGRVNDM